ncbi:MAG: hypothetical protein LBS89_08545 [Zoogloeaceae bacterium]|jgi:hypothetical protein|nr:hypothetical protein [Zoogloeaceae bacterium]
MTQKKYWGLTLLLTCVVLPVLLNGGPLLLNYLTAQTSYWHTGRGAMTQTDFLLGIF